MRDGLAGPVGRPGRQSDLVCPRRRLHARALFNNNIISFKCEALKCIFIFPGRRRRRPLDSTASASPISLLPNDWSPFYFSFLFPGTLPLTLTDDMFLPRNSNPERRVAEELEWHTPTPLCCSPFSPSIPAFLLPFPVAPSAPRDVPLIFFLRAALNSRAAKLTLCCHEPDGRCRLDVLKRRSMKAAWLWARCVRTRLGFLVGCPAEPNL